MMGFDARDRSRVSRTPRKASATSASAFGRTPPDGEREPEPLRQDLSKDALRWSRPVFPEGLLFEDLATVYPLFARANRIEKVDEFLYFYRRARVGSTMSSYGRHFEQLPRALEIMYERFSAAGPFKVLREPILEVAVVHLLLGRYADFFPYAPFAIRRATSMTRSSTSTGISRDGGKTRSRGACPVGGDEPSPPTGCC